MLTTIADHLWQSTLCAAVAWLLTLALRKNRAAVRHGIWLAASVKFLVPFSWLAAAGSRFGTQIAAGIPNTPIPAAIEQFGRPFTPPVSEFATAAATSSTNPVPTVLFAVWLCGVVISAIVWFGLSRRIHASLRAATPLPFQLPIAVMSSPGRQEPGVFGIRKPVMLLPEGIANRMSPPQLQSILAHELCHVRRRDNLTGAIHMVVESIFWFFPLVWWIGSRLVEERELACDEEVVRLGNEPHTYAEGILSVCKLYASSPLACASGVTGADLKKRIEAIVNHRISLNLTFARKLLLAVAGVVVVAGPVVVGLMNAPRGLAQSATSKFEVASIKPANPNANRRGYGSVPGGGFEAQGVNLRMLVTYAYGIKDFQLAGGPGWMTNELFDIQAKPEKFENPAGITEEAAHVLQRARMRALLEERFQLVIRKETREMPVYTLTVAKGGARLKETPPDGQKVGVRRNHGMLLGIGGQWVHVVASLSDMLRRPIVDKTGFAGKRFDFELRYAEEPGIGPLGMKPGAPPPDTQERTDAPSLPDALQSQLGLKLESGKDAVDFLFIERAEKPSAN